MGIGAFGAAASFGTGAYWAYSLGAGDVNGDGIPDLVVANICQSLGPYLECTGYGTVSVLLGNGDGTFRPAATYSTGAYDAYAVAIGDVNGDQMPDLRLLANTLPGPVSTNRLRKRSPRQWRRHIPGGCELQFRGYEADSIAIGDFNGDGVPDVVVANYCVSDQKTRECLRSVGVLLGIGDGTLSTGDDL